LLIVTLEIVDIPGPELTFFSKVKKSLEDTFLEFSIAETFLEKHLIV